MARYFVRALPSLQTGTAKNFRLHPPLILREFNAADRALADQVENRIFKMNPGLRFGQAWIDFKYDKTRNHTDLRLTIAAPMAERIVADAIHAYRTKGDAVLTLTIRRSKFSSDPLAAKSELEELVNGIYSAGSRERRGDMSVSVREQPSRVEKLFGGPIKLIIAVDKAADQNEDARVRKSLSNVYVLSGDSPDDFEQICDAQQQLAGTAADSRPVRARGLERTAALYRKVIAVHRLLLSEDTDGRGLTIWLAGARHTNATIALLDRLRREEGIEIIANEQAKQDKRYSRLFTPAERRRGLLSKAAAGLLELSRKLQTYIS